jgi:hypothetical protein
VKKKINEFILEYDMFMINILAMALLLLMLVITWGIIKVLPEAYMDLFFEKSILLFKGVNTLISFIVLILWLILHEIIHYVAYRVMGAKSKDLVFGIALEKGVFYCKCKDYINKKCIMVSLLSPFMIIGVVTYVIGMIINAPWLVLLSIANISGAAGDLVMFSFFLKQDNDIEFKELGFSSPCVIKTKKDLINEKYIGITNIKLVESQEEITEGEEKKITITKPSWIFFIVCFLVMLLGVIL